MVHFVGAGSGAADLITVRGAKLLGEADVVIYAGSLVNPALLDYTKPGCEIHDSAKLTLEEVIALIEKAETAGKTTVRLHTGDSSIYGAVREQFDELEKRGISVPEDVSIVGFDNYLYPGFPDLKITSYEINTKAMVKVALEKALKQIRGAASGKNMEIVSGQLVPKESVKL